MDWKLRRNPKLETEKRIFIEEVEAQGAGTGYRPLTYSQACTCPARTLRPTTSNDGAEPGRRAPAGRLALLYGRVKEWRAF